MGSNAAGRCFECDLHRSGGSGLHRPIAAATRFSASTGALSDGAAFLDARSIHSASYFSGGGLMAMRLSYGGNPDAYDAAIGQSLGRALFGDPEAAMQQQETLAQIALREAQTKQADAHARLFGSQADGQGIQNNAGGSLPQLFASLFGTAATAPVAMPSDPLAPLPEQQAAPGGFDEATFKAGVPAAIAAMAQMNGEDVDPNAIVGLMSAIFGDDELARRGMVGQGKTPGEDFALTPGRADAISARDASEDYREGTDVARINHASDVPVASIRAGATVDAARVRGDASRDVAQVRGKPKPATKKTVLAVRAVSAANHEMIAEIVDEIMTRRLDPSEPGFDRLKAVMTRRAVYHYRRSGNPDDAVATAWDESGLGKPKALQGGGPVRIANDADFAKLASGTQFIGPDGKRRVKP